MQHGEKSADSLPTRPTGMEKNSSLSIDSSHPVRIADAVDTETRRSKTSVSGFGPVLYAVRSMTEISMLHRISCGKGFV